MFEKKVLKDVWLLSSWVASMSMSLLLILLLLFCSVFFLFSSLLYSHSLSIALSLPLSFFPLCMYVCVSFKLSSYKVVMVVAFSLLLFFCLQVAADQFCFMLPLPSPFALSHFFFLLCSVLLRWWCENENLHRVVVTEDDDCMSLLLLRFFFIFFSLDFTCKYIPAWHALMYARTNKNE